MVKVTYTLDDETVGTIRRLADLRGKPQSLVVREAVAAYASQERKLDDDDRERRIRVLDALAGVPPMRSGRDVDREVAGIRRSRRTGWRRPSE